MCFGIDITADRREPEAPFRYGKTDLGADPSLLNQLLRRLNAGGHTGFDAAEDMYVGRLTDRAKGDMR